jgi:LacI family transcriptional regulator
MTKKTETTLESISKELSVSVSTISRVLSGKAEKFRISKKTADLVFETARKLSYSPNQLAQGLRLKRTNTIGLIIPDISNPFFAKIASYIEREARKKNQSVIVSDSEEKTEIEKSSLQVLTNRMIDGIIISPVGEIANHLVNPNGRNIPIVTIDRFFPELKLPFVGSDNFKGAFEAVNYLIQNGHKRIAFIQGMKNTSVNQERLRGYTEALNNNNISYDKNLVTGENFGEENGYVGMRMLLNMNEQPTAIFATSNLISLGVLRALEEEKLKVPDDVSIISFDDQPYSGFLSTPMTTVAQPIKEIATIAFRLLMDAIEADDANDDPKKIFLPTKLVIRNSVGKLSN